MLELVAGLIGDEAGRDGHELRYHPQAVLPQGGARLHDVHDDVRQAQNGGQLDGAVELDDVDVPPDGCIVALGDVDEFGGHPHRAAGVVLIVGRCGDAHPAPAEAGVQQLVDIGGGFGQDVLAHDAHIRCAVLDVDGHIAGLDEKIADACRRVLHHQLPGGVVVLGTAVADARQKVIDLIAQTALWQGHVQHGLFRGLLLHRRQRGAQAVQLVEVDCEADGPRPRGEFLHQQVIPPAFEHRTGEGLQIALKDEAVVVLHLTGQRHVQTDASVRTVQLGGDGVQLSGGGPHPLVPAGCFHPRQHLFAAAAELHQPGQRLCACLVQPGGRGRRPQLVEVLGPQLGQQGCAGGLGYA